MALDDYPFRVSAARESAGDDVEAAALADKILRWEWETNPDFRQRCREAQRNAVEAFAAEYLLWP